MENIINKINSLKDMANNSNLTEGKAVSEIISLLSELVEEVRNLKISTESLGEQVDAIDEDLANLEDEVYEDECDCGEEVDNFEIACPYCEETIEVKFDAIDDNSQFKCPKCNQLIELDFDSDCDCEDGCGCGHDDDDEECGGDCDCHHHDHK